MSFVNSRMASDALTHFAEHMEGVVMVSGGFQQTLIHRLHTNVSSLLEKNDAEGLFEHSLQVISSHTGALGL